MKLIWKKRLTAYAAVIVGGIMNHLVMHVNGGKMPVYNVSARLLFHDRTHVMASHATKWPRLCDWIGNERLKVVLSPGDMLLLGALFWLLGSAVADIYRNLKSLAGREAI